MVNILRNIFKKQKEIVELPKLDDKKEELNSYYTELGITGNNISNTRIIGYETNPLFSDWRNWALTAYEMVRVDPKLSGAENLLKNTLLSARWKIKPAKDAPFENMLADFAAQALGLNGYQTKMEETFERQLSKMVFFALIGALYFEEIYYIGEDNKTYLKKWASREPTSHKDWFFDQNGDVKSVLQFSYNNPKIAKEIPADKLLILTHNKTGSNIEGRGMLRPCYSYWKLKEFLKETIGVGAERWAIPTPRVTTDRRGALEAGYKSTEIDAMVSSVKNVAQNYKAGKRNYVQDTPYVSLNTYGDGNVIDFTSPLEVIRYCDQSMLTAFVMQFFEVGFQSNQGARSVGEVHESAFRRSTINILDNIADTISAPRGSGKGTIARLLEFNFGPIPDESLPILEHSGLDVDVVAQALKDLPMLVNAGLIMPTEDDIDIIRGRVGLKQKVKEKDNK